MMATLAFHLLTATLIGVPMARDMNLGAQQSAHPKIDLELIHFADSRCFQSDVSEYPLVTFYSTDRMVLMPYGESSQEWEITVIMGEAEMTFISGWFEFTFEDDDEPNTLYGEYLDFDLDLASGDYTVDWYFAGGTGDMDDLIVGFGRTLGQADLITSCADYSFNGLLLFED